MTQSGGWQKLRLLNHLPLALEEAWKNKKADNTTATDKSVATDAAQDAMQKA